MIRIPLGQGDIEYNLYLAYMIWLTEHDLVDAWHYYPECKANVVDFGNEQDALAFKLRFGL